MYHDDLLASKHKYIQYGEHSAATHVNRLYKYVQKINNFHGNYTTHLK